MRSSLLFLEGLVQVDQNWTNRIKAKTILNEWNGAEPKCKTGVDFIFWFEFFFVSFIFHSVPSLNLSPFFRIHNSSNPQWTKTFYIDYEYGSECYFFVQVFRFVSEGDEPILLGNAIFEIGDILGTQNHTKVRRLPKGGW